MKRNTRLSTLVILLVLSLFVVQGAAGTGVPQAQGPDEYPHWTSGASDYIGPPTRAEFYSAAPETVDGVVASDDFNVCSLSRAIWEDPVNPLGDAQFSLTGTFTPNAWYNISIPDGAAHDIWTQGNFAPRVMQQISNTDFQLEVKFESGLGEAYQMQGILVEQDSNDFMRFEYYGDGTSTFLFAAVFEPGPTTPLTPTVAYNQPLYAANAAPLYMRLQRQGQTWTIWIPAEGGGWQPATSFDWPLVVRKVGIYAANCCDPQAPAHTAKFDYFFDGNDPIVPEDGDRNQLMIDVDPVTGGTVGKVPDKSAYSCSEQVTLTPTPSGGWSFEDWQGPDAGSLVDNGDGSWLATMEGSKFLTATFTQTLYTLTTIADPPDKGTVTKEPDQAGYDFGDVVTVTATATQPGWVFTGWSGDHSGSTNPVTVTMTASKNITATFELLDYILTVLPPVGNGTTTPDTGAHAYQRNAFATLTVQPDSGWRFEDWLGANGDEVVKNPDGTYSLEMDGNKEIQARFRESPTSYIFLPLITRNK